MRAFDPTAVGPDPATTIIEASAGTGKTTTIASLTARAVAQGWVRIDQVMLVTFGARASTELRTRLHSRMSTAVALARRVATVPDSPQQWTADDRLILGSGGDVAQRQQRLEAALLDLDRATIATTHQFCQTMLTELGILVDHDPGSRFTDDLDDVAHQVTYDQFLRQAHQLNDGSMYASTAKAVSRVVLHRQEPLRLDAPHELVSFATGVRSQLEQRKRHLGIHSFDDMVTRLHQALAADLTDAQLAHLALSSDPTDRPPGHGTPVQSSTAHTAQRARRVLSSRFRWVMIDEYQDTDSLQWEIARAAFHGHSRLLLIGDPKQAIYGFRGADVQAYLRAVRSSSEPATLTSNWRSAAPIVAAVSDLFAGRELGESIRLVEVEAKRGPRRLGRDAEQIDPVQVRMLRPPTNEPLSTMAANELITADLVHEVRRLLECRYLDPGFDEAERPRPVSPSDIAILVRTNRRGDEIRDALLRSGVQAVFSGAGSVFKSRAAHDWLTLLEAIDAPSVAGVRRVALTSFFGHTVVSLSALDENDLADLALSVKEVGQILHRSGVAAAFAEVGEQHQLYSRLLSTNDGERVLTDLRHLSQLLHDQHRRSDSSVAGLARWLDAQITGGSSDEGTRRLESDRRAVQIMTVHRAKGLDLPIVLVPEAAVLSRVAEPSRDPAVVHDDDRRAWLELSPNPTQQQQAAQSQIDEELRLLYVALTRAKYALRVWWAPSDMATPASPLHRLLTDRYRGGESRVPAPLSAVSGQQADELAAAWAGTAIGATVVTPQPALPPLLAEESRGVIVRARSFTRQIDHSWRRTSYSALTSGLHEAAPHSAALPESQLTADEPDLEASPDQESPVMAPVEVAHEAAVISPMAEFPGGTLFGTLVHAVLEDLDPNSDRLADELARASREACATYPIDGVEPDDLAAGLALVVATPLGELSQGRSLAHYPASDRLPELDFELPLATNSAAAATVADLAAAFTQLLPPEDPLAHYGHDLAATPAAETALAGWLTGSIDAVLRHHVDGQPRHLVIDYKTNRMPVAHGTPLTVQHYSADAMADAMRHSHYPLQALLYCVALHRFLAQRLADYDPEVHLGGVGYLFVRGMAGADVSQPADMPWGVFTWRPPTALVLRADELVGGHQ